MQGRETPLLSTSNHVVFRNIELTCQIFADLDVSEYDKLKNFSFENLKIVAQKGGLNKSLIEGLKLNNVVINGKLME